MVVEVAVDVVVVLVASDRQAGMEDSGLRCCHLYAGILLEG